MSAFTKAQAALSSLLLFASCIDGGDGVGGGLTTPPPGGGGGPVVGSASAFASAGLVGAVAGSGSIHATWTARDAAGQDVDIAIFLSTSKANLFVGAPALLATQDGGNLFSGLASDQDYFLGIAQQTGASEFKPLGPVLTLHTAPPIFVRAGADTATADGLTPATAFAHPFEGVLRAFANGGGNVWISEGVYDDVNLPVFAGVHLFGGFQASFDPQTRDAELHPSVLTGRAGLSVIEVQGTTQFATLDGLTIDGAGLAPVGVSVTDTPISLRNVNLFECSGRGIRIRNQSGDRLESHALGVQSSRNGGDGLSALGPFEFCIERCAFNSNVQEGIDFDDLIGLDGEDSTLIVRASRFFGNGTQGLDVDLAAPLFPGALGSRFDVEITGCAFEQNGGEGLLVDLDFDLVPGWSARLEIGHCTARANRASGFHFDLDGESNTLLHHCLATANAQEGVLVTSETTPALAVVASSAMMGNGGWGLSAILGNAPALLSHCVIAGNALGGVISSSTESSAVACIAHEQPSPFVGTRVVGNVISQSSDDVFENIAGSWRSATALQDDRLSVFDPTSIDPGSLVEIAGDGVARTVLAVDPISGLRLDSVPEVFQAPARIAVFPPGSTGLDDLRLVPGSLAIDAGFNLPGAPTDAGVFGAPLPSVPGAGAATLDIDLKLAAISPPLGVNVAPNQTVSIFFTGAALDAATANSMSVVARSAVGTELNIAFTTIGQELRVSPPAGGWPGGLWTIELHRTLESEQGQGFASPLALPLRTP